MRERYDKASPLGRPILRVRLRLSAGPMGYAQTGEDSHLSRQQSAGRSRAPETGLLTAETSLLHPAATGDAFSLRLREHSFPVPE